MTTSNPNMYANAQTWNPFKGCDFDCTYCVPSFQRQAKRQKQRCTECYHYQPHTHPDRLDKIPSAEIIFVCGNADISFCDPDFTREIIAQIKKHNERCPDKMYYLQSKRPEYFEPFLGVFPKNVILLTTLETNRDDGYALISKAPVPSERYRQFKSLDHPRKVITIEPLLDFDMDVFPGWIIDIAPEYVWLGFNSKPGQVELPEPALEKVQSLGRTLTKAGLSIRGKSLRGLDVQSFQ